MCWKARGNFRNFSKVEVKGTKDKDTGTEYAAAIGTGEV